MPQTATDDNVTRVRLKDGTVLKLKGANLSPDEVAKRVATYRATQASTPPAAPPMGVEPADDSSIIGGTGSRLVDTVRGMYKMLTTPPQGKAEEAAGPASMFQPIDWERGKSAAPPRQASSPTTK